MFFRYLGCGIGHLEPVEASSDFEALPDDNDDIEMFHFNLPSLDAQSDDEVSNEEDSDEDSYDDDDDEEFADDDSDGEDVGYGGL